MNIISSLLKSLHFWKNLTVVLLFFIVTPITLVFALFALSLYSKSTKAPITQTSNLNLKQNGVQIYASLPSETPTIYGEAVAADARPEIIRQYLEYYNSPLTPYAKLIVDTADKYNLDFRLITAIAQQESNLCKKIPDGTNNCWGWGIHSQGTLGFPSYETAIETVSQGIRKDYLDKGYSNIDDMMSKYTPLSNGSWADGVNLFMAQMQ